MISQILLHSFFLEIIELGSCSENQDLSYNNCSNDNEALNNVWATPSLEDPLRLDPDVSEKEDNNLLSLLNNDTDRAKDLGFTASNDSEFISLERLDDRNRNAVVS